MGHRLAIPGSLDGGRPEPRGQRDRRGPAALGVHGVQADAWKRCDGTNPYIGIFIGKIYGILDLYSCVILFQYGRISIYTYIYIYNYVYIYIYNYVYIYIYNYVYIYIYVDMIWDIYSNILMVI